jgi:hypothetical protein
MLTGWMNDGVEWGPRIHHEFVAYVGRPWLEEMPCNLTVYCARSSEHLCNPTESTVE